MALQELRAGPAVAGVDPLRGGRVVSVRFHEHELLVHQGADDEDPRVWGCYLMAPWVGRLQDGRLAFGGVDHEFVADAGPHAIHGLVHDRPWTVSGRHRRSIDMRIDLGGAGWPFGGSAGQRIVIAPDRIRFDAWVRTADPSPVALGWHPWFLRSPGGGESLVVDAFETLETRGDLMPTGRRLPVVGPTDLRAHRPLLDRRLDHSYPKPAWPVVLRVPPFALRIEASSAVSAVHVYTPDRGICVEPMTAWPNAANLAEAGISRTGVVRLGRGRRLTASMTWTWTVDPP